MMEQLWELKSLHIHGCHHLGTLDDLAVVWNFTAFQYQISHHFLVMTFIFLIRAGDHRLVQVPQLPIIIRDSLIQPNETPSPPTSPITQIRLQHPSTLLHH